MAPSTTYKVSGDKKPEICEKSNSLEEVKPLDKAVSVIP